MDSLPADAAALGRLLPGWQAAFLEVELPGHDLGRRHPHRPRGHRAPIDAGLRRRPRTHGWGNLSVAPDATAFADRDAASTLLITTGGTEARIAWARETWNAFQPCAKPSAYVNYLDQGDDHRTEAVYGPNFQRLVEVKRLYDPENVFQHNANIRP